MLDVLVRIVCFVGTTTERRSLMVVRDSSPESPIVHYGGCMSVAIGVCEIWGLEVINLKFHIFLPGYNIWRITNKFWVISSFVCVSLLNIRH